MSLNISQKKQVVKDVSAVVGTAQATVIAEYRGMTVEQMKVLRREAHDSKSGEKHTFTSCCARNRTFMLG